MELRFLDFGGRGMYKKANLEVSSLGHWVDGNAVICEIKWRKRSRQEMKRSVCSQYLELTAASLGSSVEVLSGFPISIHPPEHQRKQSNLSHHLHLVRRIAAAFHVPTVGKPHDAVSISEWLVGTGSVCG